MSNSTQRREPVILFGMSTPPKGRYDSLDIAYEVQRRRAAAEMDIKTFADKTGIGYWTVYKREGGDHPYSIEELGIIAEVLHAPSGWPFLPWELGEAVDHKLLGKKR